MNVLPKKKVVKTQSKKKLDKALSSNQVFNTFVAYANKTSEVVVKNLCDDVLNSLNITINKATTTEAGKVVGNLLSRLKEGRYGSNIIVETDRKGTWLVDLNGATSISTATAYNARLTSKGTKGKKVSTPSKPSKPSKPLPTLKSVEMDGATIIIVLNSDITAADVLKKLLK